MYIILKTQVLFITYIINMSINNDNRKEKKLSSITTRRRIKTLYSHMTASSLNNNIADDGETEEPIIVNPLTATIGGEVDGSIDLSKPFSNVFVAALSNAFEKHKVLVFRNQKNMSSTDQLRLVQMLNEHWGLTAKTNQQKYSYDHGAFVIRMLYSKAGTNNVWRVASNSSEAREGREKPLNPAAFKSSSPQRPRTQIIGRRQPITFPFTKIIKRRNPRQIDNGIFKMKYGGTGNWTRYGHEATNSTNTWHSDDNYILEPPWMTTLKAIKVPSVGGDTLFSDMSQAYEDLDIETQELLSHYMIENDWLQVFPHYKLTAEESGDYTHYHELLKQYPRLLHPLVRTHPTTGRNVIYCNAIYTRRLILKHDINNNNYNNKKEDEDERNFAQQLLRDLFSLPGIPEYQFRFRWKSNHDFIMWDNRAVQHYAVSDWGGLTNEKTRLLEHVASLGTKPFYNNQFHEQNGLGKFYESKFINRYEED